MSSKSEFDIKNKKIDLLLCPFKEKCVLKKIETCLFPDFCVCPEFQAKKTKLLL